MLKQEFMEDVIAEVAGKNLSDTDLRVTFCDCLEFSNRSCELTDKQRDSWYMTEREFKKLRKATRCSNSTRA